MGERQREDVKDPILCDSATEGGIIDVVEHSKWVSVLHLHPSNRFILRYTGSFYRSIDLSFVLGRSVLWLTKLPHPLVQYILDRLESRLLPYIDDFIEAPPPERLSAGTKD